MRGVCNLVPPATAEGVPAGDLSEASSIEHEVEKWLFDADHAALGIEQKARSIRR